MPAQEEPQAASGLVGVLDRIARGLDGQPALQAGIGGGILVVVLAGAVGGIAADQLWLFVLALVVLVLAGLAAWAVTRRRPGARDETTLKVGRNARITGEAEVLQTHGAATGRVKKDITVDGDLTVGDKGKLGGSTFEPPAERAEAPPAHDAGS